MKLNKTLIALLAGSLLAGGTLQAQDAPKVKPPAAAGGAPVAPGGMRPGMMTPEKIAKELSLNDDQTTKLKEAMQERRQKMTDMRNDSSIAQEDKRAKAKEIMDAANAKIKTFLTAEQYEKYLKLAPGPRNRPGATAPGVAAGTNKPVTAPETKK